MPEKNNLHIIIAEDDIDDADVITETFTKNPHFSKVSLVANGEELLNYLKNTSNESPDVILTDINMPIIDGIEALQEILNTNELKNIPCFVYSTSINPSYKEKCDDLGVKAYLIKPYSFEAFAEIPKTILSIIEA
ncbi:MULTISPECIES: response regulator [unclassified Flavobacterium]|jgi:CheY-like chemotaxis protein|uniref:response regulator n=1 Tax=unclassified Flavobacterium TaxID=196869 RepID=UPI00070E2FC7|nr:MULTISPECIES: response regulator [unclassified Flavobacterium]KRD57937.1 response regulator receiver protein [Flavobacterium sp. Root935]MDQ1165452.1 CheY-like chemotaxis protein [Flavobacterium sp. SORGH_AS_0622]TDX10582.1 response regulator receiver domain-containing protein [Flavobacterium sp. S87F.05.LMB.W.Kidney.N]BDU26074.1 response regulator [Flavobacterium sp. GSB-24]